MECFFAPQQYISCVENSTCEVYRKNGALLPKNLQATFHPKDIKTYRYEEHYLRRKHGSHKVYSITLILKNQTTIDLDAFRYVDKEHCRELFRRIWANKTYSEDSPRANLY